MGALIRSNTDILVQCGSIFTGMIWENQSQIKDSMLNPLKIFLTHFMFSFAVFIHEVHYRYDLDCGQEVLVKYRPNDAD